METINIRFNQSPSEKISLTEQVFKYSMPAIKKYVENNMHKIKRASVFPYCIHKEMETPYGKFICVLTLMKKWKPNQMFIAVDMYQTYKVENSRNPENNGRGIFNLSSFNGHTNVRMVEYPPHVINRIAERYDESVTDMSDVELALFLKKSTFKSLVSPKAVRREDRYNNIYNEFVMNIPFGQFLGFLYADDRRYFIVKTFISEKEMKDSQFVQNMVSEELERDFATPETTSIDRFKSCLNMLQHHGAEATNDLMRLFNGVDKSARYAASILNMAAAQRLAY